MTANNILPQEIGSKEYSKYGVGVVFDWPNGSEEDLKLQLETVKRIYQESAEKYSLDMLVDGPKLVAGGCLAVFLGYKERQISVE